MTDLEEDELDSVLRQHLAARLDRHVDSAGVRFARHVSRVRRMRLVGSFAGAVLAASIAAMVLLSPFRPGRSRGISVTPPSPAAGASMEPAEVECAVFSRTFDDGTFVIGGGIPVRRLRRQVIETVEWFDPQQEARIQVSLPREQVVLVGMRKY